MKFLSAITVFFVALVAISIVPVAADIIPMQGAVGTINGNGNTQSVTTDVQQTNQVTTGTLVGNGNTQSVTSNYVGTSNVNSISGTSNQYTINNAAPKYTYHDSLDIGTIYTETTSLFMGDVLTIPMNNGKIVRTGHAFNITYQSADPLLVYVINTNDADAIHCQSNAPVLEDAYGVWDYGNINVFRTSNNADHSARAKQYLSSQAIRTFVAPEDGYYSFVMDTRPAETRFGNTISSLSDTTVDVTYIVQNDGSVVIATPTPSVIGTTSTYAVAADGSLITT
jgi:hypothetical protein